MSFIIKIFKYIAEGLVKVFGFIVSLPGIIATLFTTLGTSLYAGLSFLTSSSTVVSSACSTVDRNVALFSSSVPVQSDYFQSLAYVLALDDAWTYILGVFSFFVAAVSLILLTVVPFLLTFGFSVTVVNSSKYLIQFFVPNAYRFG